MRLMLKKVAVRNGNTSVWVISLMFDPGRKALLDFLLLIFER